MSSPSTKARAIKRRIDKISTSTNERGADRPSRDFSADCAGACARRSLSSPKIGSSKTLTRRPIGISFPITSQSNGLIEEIGRSSTQL